MPPRATAVIFDLDGTLVQTRGASWDVFRKINDEFGLGLAGPQEYFALFNGNFFASLDALCRDRADSEQVRKTFLARLRAEYNPAMVPGMISVIRHLAGHCTLAVLSSNAMEVLRRVLVANGIAYCFAHVFGGDVAPDKAAAVRAFLADAGIQYGRRCEVTYDEMPSAVRPGPSTTVLVTDTAGDIREALEAGIRAVGVAWGMHSTEELSAAGAEFVAIWPQELPRYLLGDGTVAPGGACTIPSAPSVAPPSAEMPAGSTAEHLPGECLCGCTTPLARRLVAAAAIRRDRRLRTAQTTRNAADLACTSRPTATLERGLAPGSAAELRDAVYRILQPTPGRRPARWPYLSAAGRGLPPVRSPGVEDQRSLVKSQGQ